MNYGHVDTGVCYDFVEAVLLRKKDIGNLNVLLASQVGREELRLDCVDSLEVLVVVGVKQLRVIHLKLDLDYVGNYQVLWRLRLGHLLLEAAVIKLVALILVTPALKAIERSFYYFVSAEVVALAHLFGIVLNVRSKSQTEFKEVWVAKAGVII